MSAAEEEEESAPQDKIVNILSGVGLVAAIVLLVFQLMVAQTWITEGDWMQLMD